MQIQDYLVLGAVLLCAVLAWRRLKKSKGCSGACNGCSRSGSCRQACKPIKRN